MKILYVSEINKNLIFILKDLNLNFFMLKTHLLNTANTHAYNPLYKVFIY